MEIGAQRMLDANANRAREALRVMEDYARFVMNDEATAEEVKGIRHALAGVMAEFPDAILARDTAGDVGTSIKTERELKRAELGEVVIAAGKRLSEALRVVEEVLKIDSPQSALEIEKARYRGYVVEQTLARVIGLAERFAGVHLYVLLTEKLCKLRWEKTLDAILAACSQPKERTPNLAIQLREKELDGGEFLRRARVVVEKCRAAGAISIVNDRVDIAQLAGADGVHLGQTDLPAGQARKILGGRAIIGVSTENLEQAQKAVRDGATYIGVGPMFPTTTKEKPRIAGPAYAKQAVANIPVPCVAIGGVIPRNVGELKAVGVKCVAVCSAVISDADPAARCREFLAALA
jgi:thiamine-phosphate pyrophosphorylase